MANTTDPLVYNKQGWSENAVDSELPAKPADRDSASESASDAGEPTVHNQSIHVSRLNDTFDTEKKEERQEPA